MTDSEIDEIEKKLEASAWSISRVDAYALVDEARRLRRVIIEIGLIAEQHQKNGLMRQFMRNQEGPGGNTNAYKESELWCRACDGRRMNVDGFESCTECWLNSSGDS